MVLIGLRCPVIICPLYYVPWSSSGRAFFCKKFGKFVWFKFYFPLGRPRQLKLHTSNTVTDGLSKEKCVNAVVYLFFHSLYSSLPFPQKSVCQVDLGEGCLARIPSILDIFLSMNPRS